MTCTEEYKEHIEALSRLSEQEREMLYLSFFKRIPQHEIARRYQCCRSTAGCHIRKAIGRLYEEIIPLQPDTDGWGYKLGKVVRSTP